MFSGKHLHGSVIRASALSPYRRHRPLRTLSAWLGDRTRTAVVLPTTTAHSSRVAGAPESSHNGPALATLKPHRHQVMGARAGARHFRAEQQMEQQGHGPRAAASADMDDHELRYVLDLRRDQCCGLGAGFVYVGHRLVMVRILLVFFLCSSCSHGAIEGDRRSRPSLSAISSSRRSWSLTGPSGLAFTSRSRS